MALSLENRKSSGLSGFKAKVEKAEATKWQ
jgi:hypothetical protein